MAKIFWSYCNGGANERRKYNDCNGLHRPAKFLSFSPNLAADDRQFIVTANCFIISFQFANCFYNRPKKSIKSFETSLTQQFVPLKLIIVVDEKHWKVRRKKYVWIRSKRDGFAGLIVLLDYADYAVRVRAPWRTSRNLCISKKWDSSAIQMSRGLTNDAFNTFELKKGDLSCNEPADIYHNRQNRRWCTYF